MLFAKISDWKGLIILAEFGLESLDLGNNEFLFHV